MKIVFFGSDEFAVPALEGLVRRGFDVSAVVTQPDRKKGRHLELQHTPVKVVAKRIGLKTLEPFQLNDRRFLEDLKEKNAQFFVVVSYGQILKKETLEIPKKFCVNLHASLLPKYRGAAPINWAIIKGEDQTGVTVIRMNEYMDRGDIILQKKIKIEEQDDAVSLEEKLKIMGAELLLEALSLIEKGTAQFIPQDEDKASYAPRLKKEDGLINWQTSAKEIFNRIRGLVPWPGSFTYYRGKLLKIWKAEIKTLEPQDTRISEHKRGQILEVSKEGIVVLTGEDNLVIKELQIEGKRRMSVEEFISGHKIRSGEKLG